MDNNLENLFMDIINESLVEMIVSHSTDPDRCGKIKIRPVLIRETLHFQASEYRGSKVYHSNYGKEELVSMLKTWIEGSRENEMDKELRFRQIEAKCRSEQVIILISRKGRASVKRKSMDCTGSGLSHNRSKQYIIKEDTKVPFLIDLGVMTAEGRIVRSKYDKYKQINRFLEFIEDILPELPGDREITILDFGCGKSYLTFAMYYFLKELKQYDVRITGLDLKEDVIGHCNRLAQKYGYEGLHFLKGDIADYEGTDQVDMVVTLHACDTATDYALYKAIRWNAGVILSVPCCQHEWNREMSCEQLKPVLKYGLVKERIAALLTDAVRADILEAWGYKAQILEFIDMEHTPKNILIRAVKTGKSGKAKEDYKNVTEFFQVRPTLLKLLEGDCVSAE